MTIAHPSSRPMSRQRRPNRPLDPTARVEPPIVAFFHACRPGAARGSGLGLSELDRPPRRHCGSVSLDLVLSAGPHALYSAMVQAGTKSWKAFFFGSFDSSNFITVDKPPASLWIMELFARMFGLNSWSILVPQALEGVAAVGILYTTVKRWFSPRPV